MPKTTRIGNGVLKISAFDSVASLDFVSKNQVVDFIAMYRGYLRYKFDEYRVDSCVLDRPALNSVKNRAKLVHAF